MIRLTGLLLVLFAASGCIDTSTSHWQAQAPNNNERPPNDEDDAESNASDVIVVFGDVSLDVDHPQVAETLHLNVFDGGTSELLDTEPFAVTINNDRGDVRKLEIHCPTEPGEYPFGPDASLLVQLLPVGTDVFRSEEGVLEVIEYTTEDDSISISGAYRGTFQLGDSDETTRHTIRGTFDLNYDVE